MNNLNYPKQVQIFISEVCNENCAYCPYTQVPIGEKKEILSKELSIENWIEVVKFLRNKWGIKFITLIGGEPTAKKDLRQLVEFISKNLPDVTILFSTSGIPFLKNENLRDELINAGIRNIAVSIDGLTRISDESFDLQSELETLKTGSERKSILGFYCLLKLKEDFPDLEFNLSSNCIVNKDTLDLILPTYEILSKNGIRMNLCPEQSICFNNKSSSLLTKEDFAKLEALAGKLIKIKQTKGNFLVPSLSYLKSLCTRGVNEEYKCSKMDSPTTIHILSDGTVPFCSWRKNPNTNVNIMKLVNGDLGFEDWIKIWKSDENGKCCSCSWTFTDRVSDWGKDELELSNFWYRFV